MESHLIDNFLSLPIDIFFLLLDYIWSCDIVNLVITCKKIYYTECNYCVYPTLLTLKKQINRYDTYWYWNVLKINKFSDYCSSQRLLTKIKSGYSESEFMHTTIYGFITNIPIENLQAATLIFDPHEIFYEQFKIKQYIDFIHVSFHKIQSKYLRIKINEDDYYYIDFLKNSEKIVNRHASFADTDLQICHSTNSRITINSKRYFIAFHTGHLVFKK